MAEEHERNPITIKIGSDVTLQVTVAGSRGPRPVATSISGRSAAEFQLLALTGPIYVDGDGDGKYTPPTPPDYLPSN
jgi:hypothetical protein